jgi:hypothetical protein
MHLPDGRFRASSIRFQTFVRGQRALVRLSITPVASAAKQVTEMMFEYGGGTALYEDGRLARCLHGAQAVDQHIALTSNNY